MCRIRELYSRESLQSGKTSVKQPSNLRFLKICATTMSRRESLKRHQPDVSITEEFKTTRSFSNERTGTTSFARRSPCDRRWSTTFSPRVAETDRGDGLSLY